eukprot:scaffold121073_cov65-Cyclotella_meneghiniana.AAC.1
MSGLDLPTSSIPNIVTTTTSSPVVVVPSNPMSSPETTRKKLCGVRYFPPDEILASMDKKELSAWKKDALRKRKAEKERIRRMKLKPNHTSRSKHARVYNPSPKVMATMSPEDLRNWRVKERNKRKAKKQREKRSLGMELTAAIKTPDSIMSNSATEISKNREDTTKQYMATDSITPGESNVGKSLYEKAVLNESLSLEEVTSHPLATPEEGLEDFLTEIDLHIGDEVRVIGEITLDIGAA